MKNIKYIPNKSNSTHIHSVNGVDYITFDKLDKAGVVHAFSTRTGGVSEGYLGSMNLSFHRGDDPDKVMENHQRFAKAVGYDHTKLVFSDQVHKTDIYKVTEADAGKGIVRISDIIGIDGLMTNVPGIPLMTFYADCVPIYFYDSVRKVVAMNHSGWKGTVHRMGQKTIEAMGEAFGTKPEDLRVCIGPSICRDCYEVSEDVADAFKEEFGAEISQDDSTSCYSWNGKSILMNKGNGKYQLDLWGANRLVLLDAGILPEHLAVTNVCTKCNPDLLYSHRVMGDKRGNLAAFLSLK